MSSFNHHAIIVTGRSEEVNTAHDKAIEIFGVRAYLICIITHAAINGYASFFIAPDGSKEGWEDSIIADGLRKDYLDWLSKSGLYCDYVEVQFGGDYDFDSIIRTKHSDIEQMDEDEYIQSYGGETKPRKGITQGNFKTKP